MLHPNIFKELCAPSICFQKLQNIKITSALVQMLTHGVSVKLTKLQLFEMLFPKDFVLKIMLPEMNNVIIGDLVQYGEFLRLLQQKLLDQGSGTSGRQLQSMNSLVVASKKVLEWSSCVKLQQSHVHKVSLFQSVFSWCIEKWGSDSYVSPSHIFCQRWQILSKTDRKKFQDSLFQSCFSWCIEKWGSDGYVTPSHILRISHACSQAFIFI